MARRHGALLRAARPVEKESSGSQAEGAKMTPTLTFPIENIRAKFPSLSVLDEGRRRIYLDNPAGTQVPQNVADAAAGALLYRNANLGGYFSTSLAAEEAVQGAHEAMATFLNAASYREIVIAQSTTSLTFHIAQSIGRTLKAGDEIVVTRMDHESNVGPWMMLAEDLGLRVRWVDFNHDSWVIEPSDFERALSDRTKVVALNYASNLTGSINDIAALTKLAKRAGALAYVDAVQAAPHIAMDVQALGADFLACSSYKFFGPHLGILWGREQILNELTAYKVRPQTSELPWKFETGTPQIELLAALRACVQYVEDLGAGFTTAQSRRERIAAAFDATRAWENALAAALIDGLLSIGDVTIHGITQPADRDRRVPTISFTHPSLPAPVIARRLAEQNIFVWSGHNFALEVVRSLGLDENDGVVRIGPAHYNTPEEIEAACAAVRETLA